MRSTRRNDNNFKSKSSILVKNEDNFFHSDYHRSLWLSPEGCNETKEFSLAFRWCGYFLIGLSQFCNLRQCLLEVDYSQRKLIQLNLLPKRLVDWFKAGTFVKLSWIIFFLMLIHLSCNIIYQYKFDFIKFKLDKLDFLLKSLVQNGTDGHPSAALVDEIKISRFKFNKIERTLQAIGAPHMRYAFMPEWVYSMCMCIAVLIYLVPQIFVILNGKLSYYFGRNFTVYKQELVQFDQLIQTEVDKFLTSSKNFVNALKTDQVYMKPGSTILICPKVNYSSTSNSDHIYELSLMDSIEEHKIKRQLRLLDFLDLQVVYWNAYKLLRPFNRSPKWIESWASLVMPFFIVCFTYVLMLDILISLLLITKMEPKGSLFSLDFIPSNLILLEMFSLNFFINIASTLHVSLYFFTCLDQIFLMNKLDQMAKQSIDISRLNLGQQLDRCLASNTELYNVKKQANSSLLYILMHFKIFEAQHKHLKTPFAFTIIIGLIIVFIYPIFGRLHLPYFEPNSGSHMVMMVVSTLIIPPFTLCIVSICHNYHCCVRLFQTMAKYLAHIIDTEDYYEGLKMNDVLGLSFGDNNGTETTTIWSKQDKIFSEHLVGLLRKLISHPEHLENEFAVRSIGLRFTYAHMLRLYFWFGLILISVITYRGRETQNDKSSLLSRSIFSIVDDPFKLF